MSTPHTQHTLESFINKFDHFRRTPKGNVIIHPGLSYNLIELKGEFVDELKQTTANRIAMTSTKIDDLNALEKFAIMILEDAY